MIGGTCTATDRARLIIKSHGFVDTNKSFEADSNAARAGSSRTRNLQRRSRKKLRRQTATRGVTEVHKTMDIITQGLLGSLLAQTAAPKEETRSAAVIGFAAGLLADADFLIQSANDPLLNLDYHRHFTHALVFIPAGALIAAFFLRLFFRRRLSFKRIYIYSLMGYSLSGALDACTGYGTHLFWPFSESRVALNLISIIDPIFSGALLCAGLAAVYTRRAIFARIGLIFCAAYLAFAGVQQHRALEAAESLAARRGHIPQRAVARPSFANTVIWRSVYIAEGRIYIDAVRAGVFNTRIYEGESVAHFKIDDAMLAGIPRASTLGRDIHRFAKFSDGYIGIHPALPNILGDLRYSMLPDSARPLWGIVLNPQRTERHAEFRAFRKLSPEQRRRLLNLLAGREAPRSAPLD